MEQRRREGIEGSSADAPVADARESVRDFGTASSSRNRNGLAANLAGEEQVIRWDRFLPTRFLRVLLVESDDSTRHIVAALLRKCSYHVAAVADGLKAWEVLKEKRYNFDLVLTEVVMPSLSGIGLLSKIMNNDIGQNIPVIMMSSHDSVGIVFKCMLKGAADFLVKPVRKNELRNLWQHVWRKYCSGSSGNGSRNENPIRRKDEAITDDNTASNDVSANAGNRSKTTDSTKKGSDTQSSCSKPEVEIKFNQNKLEPLKIENMKGSSEIESKLKKYDFGNEKVVTSALHELEETKDKSTGIEIQVTLPIQAAFSTEKNQQDNNSYNGPPCKESNQDLEGCKHIASINPESFHQGDVPNGPSTEMIDFLGRIATEQCSCAVLQDNVNRKDALCEDEKLSDASKSACNFASSPLWELSLRRRQLNGCKEHVFQERHALKVSEASAFSRYGDIGRPPCPRLGSSSASLCVKSGECGVNCDIQSSSDGAGSGKTIPLSVKEMFKLPQGSGAEGLGNHPLSSSINNKDAELLAAGLVKEDACYGHSSTEKENALSHSQLGVVPLPIPVGTVPFQSFCAGYGAMLQPFCYSGTSLSLHGSAAVENTLVVPTDRTGQSWNELNSSLQKINSHHWDPYYHPHQIKHQKKDQMDNKEPADPRVLFVASSKRPNISGSCSWSILNSTGSNEDTNAAINRGAGMESGNEEGFQNYKGTGLDHARARREAALAKFRMKRKDRCFEKKVRYHSRKKLAEQRPRLKGQFVRQAVGESATSATDMDD